MREEFFAAKRSTGFFMRSNAFLAAAILSARRAFISLRLAGRAKAFFSFGVFGCSNSTT
jgi:hypothetical protein